MPSPRSTPKTASVKKSAAAATATDKRAAAAPAPAGQGGAAKPSAARPAAKKTAAKTPATSGTKRGTPDAAMAEWKAPAALPDPMVPSAGLSEEAPAPDAADREARIRAAAYARWEQRGHAHGGDVDDWLDAERAASH